MTRPIMAAMLSCSGLSLTKAEKQLFAKSNPLGITLFGRNIVDKKQLKRLTEEIRTAINRDNVLIAVDQEGGRVRRLKDPIWLSYASQAELGSLSPQQASRAVKLQAKLSAFDLAECGINVNFAPVLDINHPQTTEALRSRCFSSDIATVARLGRQMIKEYINCGILPCIKHLPGHGLATVDPHLNLPIINSEPEQLLIELKPFHRCRFSPLGMTAHILLPALDDKYPLSQSTIGIQKLIRKAAGFDGFLISDAIDMKALQGSIADKALACLQAGCDAVCYCLGDISEMESLTAVCPHLSATALKRLDKVMQILHNTPQEPTLADINAYKRLVKQTAPYRETYDATEVLNILQQRTK